MLARLWVSKNVSGFHIISWAVSLGPFIPLVSLLFCLFSFIFTRGHVQSSDKYIDRHSFLLRPVIAGDNDEMLISFFNVCNCTDQGFLEAVIIDSFGVAPPMVSELSLDTLFQYNMDLLCIRIISLFFFFFYKEILFLRVSTKVLLLTISALLGAF